MIRDKRVICVLPAYNAQATLERTIREVPPGIADLFILVDDMSADGTVTEAQRLASEFPLKIITHAENRGYGANQKTCYTAAIEEGADIVVMLHPDYQYDPRLLGCMADMVASGVYDVCLGSRILGRGAIEGGMPRYKYVANRFLTAFENLLIGQKLSEFHTGYRAFARPVLETIDFNANSNGFVFDNEILVQCHAHRFRIGEISVPTRYFAEASSIGFLQSVAYGFAVLRCSVQGFLHRTGLLRIAPVLPWAFLFVLVNMLYRLPNETNPASRYASLCSLSENGTTRIDEVRHWTVDWARTPDGRYHSNKAPGPVLLAWPVFHVLDKIAIWGMTSKAARNYRRFQVMPIQLHLLSIVFQVIPCATVVLLCSRWLSNLGVSIGGVHFFVLAMFFGTTPSLFMNSFFGHGMTAVFSVALAITLVRGKSFWAGFFFGNAVLTDYGAALLLPGILLVLCLMADSFRSCLNRLFHLAAGGVVPGAVWIGYHTINFGSPFRIANHYQNPLFVDANPDADGLAALFHGYPQPELVYELLLGQQRGLIVTQPWALVILSCLLISTAKTLLIRRAGNQKTYTYTYSAGIFALVSFLFLMLMNASFGGWHGGSTPGPRYLSPILPTFALLGALYYDDIPIIMRRCAQVGLGLSLSLALCVFASTPLAPESEDLWPSYWNTIFVENSGNAQLHVAVLLSLSACALLGTITLRLDMPGLRRNIPSRRFDKKKAG